MGPPSEDDGKILAVIFDADIGISYASMGPPSEDDGKTRSFDQVTDAPVLQWGRRPRTTESGN